MAARVLIVNPGADVYGSDLQMLESITAMREAGWDVVVAAPNDGPLREKVLERGARFVLADYPVVRRSYLSATGVVALGGALARSLGGMSRLLRTHRPDLVYVNTVTLPWWLAFARARRVPVVCHVHEAEVDRALVLQALYGPLRAADHLILNSRTTRDAIAEVIPGVDRRSTIVTNGVPDRDRPVQPAPTGEPVRLGYVARISPRKGTDVAIEALRLVRESGRPAVLEIAGAVFPGNEWFLDQLTEQVRTGGLSDAVTFSGYVSPSRVVFDRCAIVLSPALSDSFGNSVVEAQLAERPVIAADAGGHRETIDDGRTGLLTPPGDAAAMADAIGRLIDDPALAARLATQARANALTQFGMARYRERLIGALSPLIAPGVLAAPPT